MFLFTICFDGRALAAQFAYSRAIKVWGRSSWISEVVDSGHEAFTDSYGLDGYNMWYSLELGWWGYVRQVDKIVHYFNAVFVSHCVKSVD